MYSSWFTFLISVCSTTLHIVTRVENTSTTSEAQALGPEISKQTSQPSWLEARSCPGIEERLRNAETHLGYGPGTVSLNYIDTGCPVKKLWVIVQFWTKSIPMHPLRLADN